MIIKLNSFFDLTHPATPEIIWVKNVRAIGVCGFLMKYLKENLKKTVGAVWELPAK